MKIPRKSEPLGTLAGFVYYYAFVLRHKSAAVWPCGRVVCPTGNGCVAGRMGSDQPTIIRRRWLSQPLETGSLPSK